ncbi:putative acyl-CoA:6-aminopenicillanic-acid-acyltransferase [Exophiala viscosa]|uniref:Acyl-CoA:6-aminopenicillanic-acid-acyltransferase n=1 Tax=Exophiala viscosa TaxID=2486360 RepID=A0AAN6E2M0_9EURO|nr:putative acyl-CoA:6-aminopenicillanic-acid-acyltransferase [Exophiala viscosa]KAI1629400.1 putative acyl-CoA:6-aminopenicillanic-acid-acyltransferase [Exophiala viscosa]
MASLPRRIELSGSPRKIGIEHGRQLSREIRSEIQLYGRMFQATTQMSWPSIQSIAREFATTIATLVPEIYAEIEGIAGGAGVDVLDVVAINARSDIAHGLFSDGCSSLGWDRKHQGVLLAQNWDWTTEMQKNVVLMSITQPDKPKIWMVPEAGMVGKIGFNSASVGTCLNSIRAKPVDTSKLPVHVALRVCLNSRSRAEAIQRLTILGSIASAQHILLADPAGPVSLELTPLGDTHIYPDSQGIVCHTNHLVSNGNCLERPWADSPFRMTRMQELLQQLVSSDTPVDGARLREHVFSDTLNAPYGICRQDDPAMPPERQSSTLFCIVIRLGVSTPFAELIWGQPVKCVDTKVMRMPW